MTKFLLGVVAGLALLASAPAHADVPMPRALSSYAGPLCDVGYGYKNVTFYSTHSAADAICESRTIELEPYGFIDGIETVCVSTKVTIVERDPNMVTPIYDIMFRCNFLEEKKAFKY